MSARSRARPWWREEQPPPPMKSFQGTTELYLLADREFFTPPASEPGRLEWYEPPAFTVSMPRFNMVIRDLRDDDDE